MIIGVLKEPSPETRVSLLPEHIATLSKLGANVYIEQDAGAMVFSPNEKYIEAGASVASREEILKNAEILLSINPPSDNDISATNAKVLLGFFHPLYFPEIVSRWANKGLTTFSTSTNSCPDCRS